MKELEHIPQDAKKSMEIRQVLSEKTVQEHRVQPGHKFWELDLETKLITEAKVETISATMGGGTRKKVIQRPNCLYVSALNARNADKKFLKAILAERMISR
jgi:hypothetical protein